MIARDGRTPTGPGSRERSLRRRGWSAAIRLRSLALKVRTVLAAEKATCQGRRAKGATFSAAARDARLEGIGTRGILFVRFGLRPESNKGQMVGDMKDGYCHAAILAAVRF